MPSVDSKISLALAAKLQMIFEKDDKFLVFPRGLGFDYRQLAFMEDLSTSGLSALEQSACKREFAQLLNLVPVDSPVYVPDAQTFLWDKIKNILTDATFAQSILTADEERQLTEATNFLTVQQLQSDGTSIPVNSAALNKYYEYKTIYDTRVSDYLDQKITVDNGTGSESDTIKQEWTLYKKKQLEDAVARAEQDWKNLGFKDQVENYQSKKNNLEPKKYLLLYREAYKREIEIAVIGDATIQNPEAGYLTFFSPSDAFAKNLPWPGITLTKQEMATLIQNAPANIKTLFDPSGGTGDDIESVTLEYNNVVIMRPWFKPEFFSSRYWKLSENTLVSDGNTPRNGLIPAFITSMLVVRDIKITRKKEVTAKPFILSIITATATLDMLKAKGAIQKIPEIAQKKQLVFNAAKLRPTISKDVHTAALQKIMPVTAVIAGQVAGKQNPVAMAPIKSSFVNLQLTPLKNNIPATTKVISNYATVKYLNTTIKSPAYVPLKILIPVLPAKPGPVKTTEIVTETFPLDGPIVVAYICKRVPKSPSPDETLKW